MSNIIDKIRLSGVTYTLSGQSSGASVVELTQVQYDALVDKDPNTFYVITDAIGVDVTTTITSGSTNSQVPTAKAVYDVVGDIETLLSQI